MKNTRVTLTTATVMVTAKETEAMVLERATQGWVEHGRQGTLILLTHPDMPGAQMLLQPTDDEVG